VRDDWVRKAATIRVVDVARQKLLHDLPLTVSYAVDLAFTADGRLLLTAADRRVVLRDVGTGRPVHRYPARDPVEWTALDEHGRTAALAQQGGFLEVVDLRTGRRLARLDTDLGSDRGIDIRALTFSPDGRWLAAGSDGGRVVVWDTRSWRIAAAWTAVDGGAVASLVFTPDSRFLVTGGPGTASIWDVEQGAAAGATIEVDRLGSHDPVSVGVRDDGETIVTVSDSTGVQQWNVGAGALAEHACRVAGRSLTIQEWERTLPERPWEPTCPQQPAS
jgi:WD40 repeat protein